MAMPDQVVLTTGNVLRNVKVIRWEKDRVVLKHAGGADPIAYALIKSPDPETLAKIRNDWRAADAPKGDTTAAPTGSELMAYNGQAFIVTRGAGNYKLGGITVYIFLKSADDLRNDLKWASSLPQPEAIATIDSDGRFAFKAPAKGYVTLVVKAQRLAGAIEERYLWVYDVDRSPNRAAPLLTNSNLEPKPYVESGAYNSL